MIFHFVISFLLALFCRWVEGKTLDKIKGLLPPGSIDATTRMALVNAAYFKGMFSVTS